ncbi:GvpL/GvpF family gas vesicle protein [Pseudonocardia acaciae]|uniref:GvpL/GvpF family gas vesicle protein n=1 Tax=Pseudonocardia acaciae TaxID=551276 RepID=UPI00048A77FF|nr:GvpL/GvpF family gas vesicle protein [Pseudonocardia acaciae]
MTPAYVYGLVAADAEPPEDLVGLGPSGRVSTITRGRLAALVSDAPTDRAVGTADDILGHQRVVDAVAATTAILPMRFGSVVDDPAEVADLLATEQDRLSQILAALQGRVQYTLRGSYRQEIVLRELLERDAEISSLRERIDGLPEDASYPERVRLGERVVNEMTALRELDAARMLERLTPTSAETVEHPPASPEDVIDAAFLVDRAAEREFSDAVDEVGREFGGRVRLRLLGPVAPYDFVPGRWR